jgi:hypothetical protein
LVIFSRAPKSHSNFRKEAHLYRFDITPQGQQIHIAFGENELKSSRHPCFKVDSPDALLALRKRIWEHFERKDEASPREADKPGEDDSGTLFFDLGGKVDAITDSRARCERSGVPKEILCEGLCGE